METARDENGLPPQAPPDAPTSAIGLLLKGALLLVAACATIFAVFAFVPDGNDYAEATVLKHRRLDQTSGRRIVLVGGSNLAFGVDSTVVERRTGCAVVNMGMNGYLGLKYMLAETRPHLRPADLVVISLEYDNFYKPVQGTATDQLMIVKANPTAIAYLDWEQRAAAVGAIPYVAQQKVLRVMRESLDRAWMHLFNIPIGTTGAHEIADIESLAGFTVHGDLTSHLGVAWPWGPEDGTDLTNTARDENVIPLLQAFSTEMRARGVEVLISHTSVMRDYYRRHERAIESLYAHMMQTPALRVPSPPSAFVYDDQLFFDTVYHLNADGRRQRSERLASDIVQQLSDGALCQGPGGLVTKNEEEE